MHDANGLPLKRGDQVIIRGTVVDTCATEEYCNCTVETVLGRRPDGQKEQLSAINTGVLEKLADETVELQQPQEA